MKTPTYKSVQELKSYFVNEPMVNQYGSISDVRTTYAVANNLLLDNESIIKGGCVYYFSIKHLGMNAYQIKLRPKGKVNTFMVDAFEPHTIDMNQYF